MKVINGLYYTEDHEWVKVEGDMALIGITDYAQHSLGDIVYVELPEVDDEFSAKDIFGVVESVKAASDIYIPVDGKVLEVNEALVDDPSLVNSDAFGSWMIKIELGDVSQLDSLMNSKQYEEFISKEE